MSRTEYHDDVWKAERDNEEYKDLWKELKVWREEHWTKYTEYAEEQLGEFNDLKERHACLLERHKELEDELRKGDRRRTLTNEDDCTEDVVRPRRKCSFLAT